MCKQRKNERNRTLAKAVQAMHLKGEKGPSSTTPKHGKNPANRLYTAFKRGAKDQRGGKKVGN